MELVLQHSIDAGNGASDFTGTENEAVYEHVARSTIISIDTDADTNTDLEIEITGSISLTDSDFVLA